MVAFSKAYRKTLTPDRSAKDSGHRYYSANLSRWLNRDPIEEDGGLNLYALVANEPVAQADKLGLGFGFLEGAHRWLTGPGGEELHVPFADYDQGWGAADFNGMHNYVVQACNPCPSPNRIEVDLSRGRDLFAESISTIFTIGGPGRINVRLKGYIRSYRHSYPPCRVWKFAGTVTIDPDEFNFDYPLDPNRTPAGQVITTVVWLAHHLADVGRDFMVVFDGSRRVRADGICRGP